MTLVGFVGELVLCTGYRLRSESLYSIIVHCPQTPHHQERSALRWVLRL